MFTGIVTALGEIVSTKDDRDGAIIIDIGCEWSGDLAEGESVAVNGACLTVLENNADAWKVRLMQETLNKTNLGNLEVGSRVNLERALKASDRLSGHFVLGHVDGLARIESIEEVGDDRVFKFKVKQDETKYLIEKGSIALDGTSLTVVDVSEDWFSVSLMPYTLEKTVFGNVKLGYEANIEYDMLAKQVVRVLEFKS